MIVKIKEKLHNTPLWIINGITILSGISSIVVPVAGFVIARNTGNKITSLAIVTITMFIIISILFVRMKKYRQIALKRMSVTSDKFHRLTHESRNVFFDIMHSHKKNVLTENELISVHKNYIENILDDLCEVMNSFTEKKICACVKLFSYTEDEEIIDENESKLITFCRSRNSDTDRENYERNNSGEIFLKDNTDFRYIVDVNKSKDYFYKGDLIKYDNELKRNNDRYRNSNENWINYYKGTIVVPIRIEFKRLYHQRREDSYHLIGFLCVDSMDTDAFKDEQENYNVNVLKAYADMIYILLSQYKHYLKTLRIKGEVTI